MKRKKNLLFLMVILGLTLIPTQSAYADIGPKPTMEFEFIYESGTSLDITEGVLMECEDAACNDASPLREMGPQRFQCNEQSCSSMAYGYAEQFYLVITFSDGKTRESNLFGKEHFEAYYQVTVRENDLLIEEARGYGNPMEFLLVGAISGICLIGGLSVGLVVAFIVVAVKGKGEDSGEGVKAGWFVAAWIIGIILLLVGGVFTLAIPFTVAIELFLGWLYTVWRDRQKRVVLPVILIANVVTSMALWTLLTSSLIDSSWIGLIIGEGLIWLVEAVIIYLPLRKAMRFYEALLLSLALNAASFGVGLLLPF